MKKNIVIILAVLSIFVIGCQERIVQPDIFPPIPPRGIITSTGDNMILLSWASNPERDVAGYNVYVSSSYNGKYNFIGSTKRTSYNDLQARNGYTYYYAVTAYDYEGNESDLSKDVAYDTPRPEGFDVRLTNFRTDPGYAGYDFSTYSIGNYDDDYTDVFFEYSNGSYYLNVWEDSDIRDMGYTSSLYDIEDAPLDGWSSTKDARVVEGHTYVIWTWDDHYAKLRVTSVTANRVLFDWAYQLQKDNTRLKRAVQDRNKTHLMGQGARSRM